jgi:hypothetical protein
MDELLLNHEISTYKPLLTRIEKEKNWTDKTKI